MIATLKPDQILPGTWGSERFVSLEDARRRLVACEAEFDRQMEAQQRRVEEGQRAVETGLAGLAGLRARLQRVEGARPMGYVHERAKPDTLPPRSRPVRTAMGQVHHRPDPPTDCPFVSIGEEVPPRPPKPPFPLGLPREECVWWHCVREAKREIDALTEGRLYVWTPYVPHWSDCVQPLDCTDRAR